MLNRRKALIAGICVFLCAVIAVSVICSLPKYDEGWIMGKSVAQIQKKYGEFDDTFEPVDGAIVCGTYRLSDSDYGKDHYDWDDRVKIYFDKSGTAIFVSTQRGAAIRLPAEVSAKLSFDTNWMLGKQMCEIERHYGNFHMTGTYRLREDPLHVEQYALYVFAEWEEDTGGRIKLKEIEPGEEVRCIAVLFDKRGVAKKVEEKVCDFDSLYKSTLLCPCPLCD